MLLAKLAWSLPASLVCQTLQGTDGIMQSSINLHALFANCL